MKKQIAFVLIGAAWLASDLTAQTLSKDVKISQARCRIVYEPVKILMAGTDNILHFETGVPGQRLLVNANQGVVRQTGEDFIVSPERPGIIVLSIYNYHDPEQPQLIGEIQLDVADSPTTTFAGKTHGTLSKSELSGSDKIGCLSADEFYSIREYKLSIAGIETGYMEFHGKGEELTAEMKSCLAQLTHGDKIYIEYIRAAGKQSCSTRQLPPLSFTVSD